MSFGREHKGRMVRLVKPACGFPVGHLAVVDWVWRGRYRLTLWQGAVYQVPRDRFEFVDPPPPRRGALLPAPPFVDVCIEDGIRFSMQVRVW